MTRREESEDPSLNPCIPCSPHPLLPVVSKFHDSIFWLYGTFLNGSYFIQVLPSLAAVVWFTWGSVMITKSVLELSPFNLVLLSTLLKGK